MKTAYPVIFTRANDSKDTVLVEVPDLEILTESSGLANAIEMARDAIGLAGITKEDMGFPIAKPSGFKGVTGSINGNLECNKIIRGDLDMIYNDFKELKLSKLGFGMMRLPQRVDGSIDEEQAGKLVDHAISHGMNYFDTAYFYHEGQSEVVTGKLLKKYPRKSYYLADKYPGTHISGNGHCRMPSVRWKS